MEHPIIKIQRLPVKPRSTLAFSRFDTRLTSKHYGIHSDVWLLGRVEMSCVSCTFGHHRNNQTHLDLNMHNMWSLAVKLYIPELLTRARCKRAAKACVLCPVEGTDIISTISFTNNIRHIQC